MWLNSMLTTTFLLQKRKRIRAIGSGHFWVYTNLFRGSLIDCAHFRSMVLKLSSRKVTINTQNHVFYVVFCSKNAWQMMRISMKKHVFFVFIVTFRDESFKIMLRKYAQSIRLPRNRFVYTQKCLVPIARMRFFLKPKCTREHTISLVLVQF